MVTDSLVSVFKPRRIEPLEKALRGTSGRERYKGLLLGEEVILCSDLPLLQDNDRVIQVEGHPSMSQ